MANSASSTWIIEPLSAAHQRDLFACTKPSLDEYLKRYAMQNQRKNVGRTFVAVRPGQTRVKGYYTVSSGSLAFAHLPEEVRKGLPKYPVPVVHMGRLAVAVDVQGGGLGALLLADALRRTQRLASELGICGMEVYALDQEAKGFYLRHGFVELADDQLHLYLPMVTIQQLVLEPETRPQCYGGETKGKTGMGDKMRRALRNAGGKIAAKSSHQLVQVQSVYQSLSLEDRAELRKWLANLRVVGEQRPSSLRMLVLVCTDNTTYDRNGNVVEGGTALLSPEVMLKAMEKWERNEAFIPTWHDA